MHAGRWPVDETPPPLVAKITISEEKEDVTETKGIRIDDHPYVKLMKITEWASYNECLKFSADTDASERGIDA